MDCRVVTFQNDVKSTSNGLDEVQEVATPSDESLYCLRAIRIDEISRLLFPLSFLLFNVFYWSYYTTWSKWVQNMESTSSVI